jgi:hypothetical protein
MSRLDKTMTTMMLGEMAAGAFGRALAAAGGSAQASAAPAVEDVAKAKKDLADAKEQMANKEKEAKDAQKAADEAKKAAESDATKKAEAEQKQKSSEEKQKEFQKAQQTVNEKQRDLLEKVTTAVASATPALNIGSIIGRTSAPSDTVAIALTALQEQYLEASDASTLLDACITAMDMMRTPTMEQLQRLTQAQRAVEAHDEETQRLKGIQGFDLADREAKRKDLVNKVNEIEDELSMSQLARFCRTSGMTGIQKDLIEQRTKQAEKAKADLERTRIELCRTAAQSTDEKMREAAVACTKKLTEGPPR